MSTFNFDILTEEQKLALYELWLAEDHAAAKKFLLDNKVVVCLGCLDTTTYRQWMLWWINKLQTT